MYMIVTNDELELPVAQFENVHEIAAFLHISPSTVRVKIHRNHWKREKIIRVNDEKKRTPQEYQTWYHKTHDRSEYFRRRYQMKKERKLYEQRIGAVEGSCKDAGRKREQ